MHQNTYNHDESERSYWHHIKDIAYRFNFTIIHDEYNDLIEKIENGIKTIVVSSPEIPRNALCCRAWRKLIEEYE